MDLVLTLTNQEESAATKEYQDYLANVFLVPETMDLWLTRQIRHQVLNQMVERQARFRAAQRTEKFLRLSPADATAVDTILDKPAR